MFKKIKKEWDLMDDKRLYIEEKIFQNLPEFFRYYRNFPRSLDFIILDSFGEQTYKRRVELYEKVKGSGGGVGAALLIGNTCDGCRLAINAVEMERIKSLDSEEVLRCEECRRILVRI